MKSTGSPLTCMGGGLGRLIAGTTGGLGRAISGEVEATFGLGRMRGGCLFTRLGISDTVTGGSFGYGRDPPLEMTGGGGGGAGTGGCDRTGVCTGNSIGGAGGRIGAACAGGDMSICDGAGIFVVDVSPNVCNGNCVPDGIFVPSGLKVIDSDGSLPSKIDAGSFISGKGISLGSSPGLGGSYTVGGRGMVMVPGGSALESSGLPKPFPSCTSSVSPSSTDVIIISGLFPEAGTTPEPEQQVGRHPGEQLRGHPVIHWLSDAKMEDAVC